VYPWVSSSLLEWLISLVYVYPRCLATDGDSPISIPQSIQAMLQEVPCQGLTQAECMSLSLKPAVCRLIC